VPCEELCRRAPAAWHYYRSRQQQGGVGGERNERGEIFSKQTLKMKFNRFQLLCSKIKSQSSIILVRLRLAATIPLEGRKI